MNKQDKKEIKMVMGEALEEVVLPRLQKIEDDMVVLKENDEELQLTTNRIEMKLDAEVERHDNISIKIDKIDKRVLKFEAKSLPHR